VSCFPGRMAGASLRANWWRPNVFGGHGFPGRMAGASLRAVIGRDNQPANTQFPRPNGRGFIEGLMQNSLFGKFGAVSPAEWPGLH
jgi:hypothetical protein